MLPVSLHSPFVFHLRRHSVNHSLMQQNSAEEQSSPCCQSFSCPRVASWRGFHAVVCQTISQIYQREIQAPADASRINHIRARSVAELLPQQCRNFDGGRGVCMGEHEDHGQPILLARAFDSLTIQCRDNGSPHVLCPRSSPRCEQALQPFVDVMSIARERANEQPGNLA